MYTPLSRRTVLKASGIAIGLPLLESMRAGFGDDSPSPPKRMVLICNTLGLHPPSLFPTDERTQYTDTPYMRLLKDHHDRMTLFAGLSHPDQNGKEPHDTELTFLTSARNPGLGGFRNSISIDQYAARFAGPQTRFPSISLSTHTRKSQSYTANGVMIPAEDRPSTLFAKLFLAGSPDALRRQHQRLAEGRSVLDAVAEQIQSLRRRTSVDDHRQLDQYFESIRQAEHELNDAEAWLDRPKPQIDQEPPTDIPDPADLIGRINAWVKLIPLILQTDSSRIISLVIQDHHMVPKINGVSTEHHILSHHGQDPDKIAQLKIIETSILGCVGDLLNRLSNMDESGARLIDHSSVLLGSNLGNANAHNPTNLPIILAGGGHDHARFVKHDARDNTPLCNLFVALLNHLGIETDRFGTSSGSVQI